MSEPTKAVFLSYASQDAEAARRICEALRSGGVEVWFDADGGLEHGDEWDQKIRKQIKECVLFIAVISANTQAREEGYFRLEWDLAAERARTIASGVPFILPVVIDDTREPDALVPDRFRIVQWTRLRGGDVPPEVKQRFLKLWSHRTGVLKHQELESGRFRPGERGEGAASPAKATTRDAVGKPGAKNYALVAAAVLALVAAVGWWFLREPAAKAPSGVVAATRAPASAPTAEKATPLSEARQLAAKARALFDALDCTRDDFKLAEDYLAQAKAKAPMDAEVWAIESELHERYLVRGWDVSDTRREAARSTAQRAIRLDLQSFEARLAQAQLLHDTGSEAAGKERLLRDLRRERPTDQRVLRALAQVLDRTGRMDEAAVIADESAALPGGDPLALYNKSMGFWFAGRITEVEPAIQASLAQKSFTGALLIAAWYRVALRGDVDGARNYIERINPADLSEDRAAFFAFYLEYLARRPDAAIARLQAVPRDWLDDFWYRGPKGQLVGDALDMGKRHDAAIVEWTAALKLVDQRLVASPSNPVLIYNRARLLVHLGQREEAERQFSLLSQMKSAVDISSADAIAKCYAMLGYNAEAIKRIARGLKLPTHAVTFPSGELRLDPVYDGLRDEPEFAKVIAEAEALERAPVATAPKSDLTTTTPAKVDDKSVAVLAFDNLSDDKANEYFSDGISEELINALGRVPGLTVKGRTSAFFFKGKNATAQDIAEKLSVNYLVRGSVRKAGGKVRITAQLSRAATDEVVWSSEPLERELKDVFAVQDEIATLIARNLSVSMGVTARAQHPVKAEALAALLEGRHFWVLRTAEGFARADELFNRAVTLDPQWAPAHAALANLLAIEASFQSGNGQPMNERFAQATREAKRAIELDPTLGEPHAALGKIAMETRRVSEAEAEFYRALALEPNNALVHDWHGDMAVTQGRLDLAITEYRRALEIEPLSPYILWDLAWELMHVRRYGEALALVDRAIALTPSGAARLPLRRARLLMELGRTAEAEAAVRSYLEGPRDGGDPQFTNEAVWGLRALDSAADRERWTAVLLRENPESYSSGVILFMLGQEEKAYPLLERCPSIFLQQLYWDPAFDRVRDTPRFQQLLEKLGCAAEYKVARETLARLLKESDNGK